MRKTTTIKNLTIFGITILFRYRITREVRVKTKMTKTMNLYDDYLRLRKIRRQ